VQNFVAISSGVSADTWFCRAFDVSSFFLRFLGVLQ